MGYIDYSLKDASLLRRHLSPHHEKYYITGHRGSYSQQLIFVTCEWAQ